MKPVSRWRSFNNLKHRVPSEKHTPWTRRSCWFVRAWCYEPKPNVPGVVSSALKQHAPECLGPRLPEWVGGKHPQRRIELKSMQKVQPGESSQMCTCLRVAHSSERANQARLQARFSIVYAWDTLGTIKVPEMYAKFQ